MCTEHSKYTRRESILAYIWEKIGAELPRRLLCDFLCNNDFDTDCIEDDVKMFDDGQSSLLQQISDTPQLLTAAAMNILQTVWLPERIRKKRHGRIMGQLLATGYPLLYWEWYRTASVEDQWGSRLFSFIDFGGHTFQELSVDPHFDNLKQEVLEARDERGNSLIGPNKFRSKVLVKSEDLLQSSKGKRIQSKPFGGDGGDDPLHFGIKRGSKPLPRHMQALVLYCDFTRFSALFSKSLRKSKATDGLKQVKKQNSMFFHVSKSLREMVAYFGCNGNGVGHMNDPPTKGPFYTGLTVVLHLKEFSIGINVPTSTSMNKAAAINFAREDGMLITIENQQGNSWQQPLFNVNWVSSYPHEEECLWFGSVWRLSVEGIYLVKKTKKYSASIVALHLFDAALSGQNMRKLSINSTSLTILHYCLKHVRKEAVGQPPDGVDNYVLDTAYAFCRSKTKILLSLSGMRRTPSEFYKLIFYEISSRKQSARARCNLFRSDLFELFPNLVELELWADEFSLDLSLMLSILGEAAIPLSFNVLKLRAWTHEWLEAAFQRTFLVKQAHFRHFGKRTFEISLKTINFVDWMFITADTKKKEETIVTLQDCTVEQMVTLFSYKAPGPKALKDDTQPV